MPTSHGDQPATRADVRALDEKMEGRLQQFESKMDGRFADVDRLIKEVMKAVSEAVSRSQLEILERTQEMVRDAQTELLRGFEVFAGGQNIRFRKVQADLSNVDASTDQRLVVLEHRMLEIEQRLLITPHPPPPPAP